MRVPDVQAADAQASVAQAKSGPGTGAGLPAVELSGDLMFKLVGAELSVQRGEWAAPFVTMMAVAQQTRDPRVARRAVEIALAAKQSGEALAAARLWRSLAPDSEEALHYFLNLAVAAGRLAEASPLFERRLRDVAPAGRGLAMFKVQQTLARARDKAAAFGLLESLLAPYHAAPEARLVLAQGALVVGDRGRAVAEAQAALERKPDSELAALTLAQVTPDKADAVKALAAFLHSHPKAREVRVAHARLLIDQKRYAAARAELEILLADAPQDLSTIFALGVVSMKDGDPSAAERHFKVYLTELAANPDSDRDPTQVLLTLSQIAEDRNDSHAALGWLGQIEVGEDNAAAWFGAQIKRALLTARHGDVAAARRQLAGLGAGAAGRAADPGQQVQIVLAEAQILRDAGQVQQSFGLLESAMKRFPDDPDLLYDYAMLAERLGRLELMETLLRQLIAVAPDNQHAYNALGFSLAERNVRLQEAYALIDRALQLAPQDPFIMDSMGWVQFRLARLHEAEETLRRAYALRPDAEIAVHLGEVLWHRGKKEDAQKFWRDANSKDPGSGSLKSTLARLNAAL